MILEVDNGEVWNQPGLNQVNPTSMIEALVAEGAGNHSGVQLMSKGKVKWFNDQRRRKIIGNLDGKDNHRVYLALPDEVDKLLDEAIETSNRVIIIIRIQQGKKGPNAVNVKLA